MTATSGGASGDPGGAVGGAVGGVSRRERPAKPALSRAGIVAAGLAILQSRGFAAVTMRSVAAALDTGPASLYAYVANRDELLREMLNVVLSEVPVPSVDPLRWREQLKDLLRDSTRAMERHPGIARVAMGYIPTEEHAMVVADTMLALLAAGGVGPQASAWAVDLLSLFITATAYETSLYSGGGPPDLAMMHEVVATVRASLAAMPVAKFPMLSAMAVAMTSGSGEERFEFGLDVLINGLVATPEPPVPLDPLALSP